VVVDPRKTPLAAGADLWLPLRPGTDLALALGMIQVMIHEELYDREFVERWCHGFDELRQRTGPYTLERTSEITWLEPDAIREAAYLYATNKPAALHHRVAVEHNVNATQTDRALAILVGLSGNLDVKGGNVFSVPIEGYIPTIALAGAGPWLKPPAEVEEQRIGIEQYPLIAGPDAPLPFVHSGLALDTMLTGEPYPLKALYCAGANPVINMQNVKKVWQALQGLDLLVVTDFFLTPTAELADYVLPATTWLERDECCDISYMNFVSSRRKAVEPLDECRDDLQIVIDLVKRIPWADRELVPWDDVHACYDWMVSGLGMSFREFQEKGCVTVSPRYEKHEGRGFDTPTGKVELYSTLFEKHGLDPIPEYQEPPESPFSTPGLARDYPLILISGGRHIAYFHSEGRQISALRKLSPEPEIEIHPETARALGLEESDWIWIETPRNRDERTSFRVRLTEGIDTRVVHVPHGWWFPEKPGPEHGCFDANINVVLTADPPRDPVCGSVPTRGTLCRVSKRHPADAA
jgi:anaerobic selenocysteine-containing dehydrogenase